MDAAHIRLGRLGEDAALARYREAGWELLARNWRCAHGELDLVVTRAGVIAFCEVKTRGGDRFGEGFEAVTRSKQARIRRLASVFLSEHGARGTVRFDVASVCKRPGRAAAIEIFEDAF